MKTFLCQPICKDIRFRSPCDVRKTILYNNNDNKIYLWMSVRFTQYHTLLHNPTILHKKIFFAPACHHSNIYRCMTAQYTINHTILHNPTILHTKTFFASSYHPRKIYRCTTAHSTRHHTLLHNYTILHMKTFFVPTYHPCQKSFSTSKYDSNTHSSRNIYLLTFLVLGLGLYSGFGSRYNYPLSRNRYTSLHVNKRVASCFYFCIICK